MIEATQEEIRILRDKLQEQVDLVERETCVFYSSPMVPCES